ncbi:MAG: hypothetical protein Q4B54_14505, partial [Coriobacteriales bacterium]|nr:hypothetical protein [Coriobacteriales bacterium]
KLTREFAFHGVEATVCSVAVERAYEEESACDLVLLAPQVAYAKPNFHRATVASVADYTRVNAKKIANAALAMVGE